MSQARHRGRPVHERREEVGVRNATSVALAVLLVVIIAAAVVQLVLAG